MTLPTEFRIISQKYSNSNHWSTEIELYQTLFHWKFNIQRTMEFHLIISFHYVDNRICMDSLKDKSRQGPNTSKIYNIYEQLMWYGEHLINIRSFWANVATLYDINWPKIKWIEGIKLDTYWILIQHFLSKYFTLNYITHKSFSFRKVFLLLW